MSKTGIVCIFLLSIPVALGFGLILDEVLPRLSHATNAYLGGLLAVPLTFLAIALVWVEGRE
jgi:hypothetical protein